MPAERRLHVMGSGAHVLAVGARADEIADTACERLHRLEARWSRFRPDSEISRMNAGAGNPVVVSPDTYALVVHAVEGWRRTNGRFDPTVLRAVRAAGYDADFAAVRTRASYEPAAPAPAFGPATVVCDPVVEAVTVPPGVEIDPGGIGKGLAADLVTGEMIAAGADGALVNVGGDVRVRGRAPHDTWIVAVLDPARADAEFLRVGLHDGAVCTSSRVRRQWSTTAGPMHHLVDPRTGRPAASRYATVCAITSDAWWAEVVAKAVFVGGLTTDQRGDLDAHVATIADDGTVELDPSLQPVLA